MDRRTTSPTKPTVTVVLPGPLLRLFPDAEATTMLDAATVDDMLDALDTRWPGMRDRIADESPAIRRHMNVFVDGERSTLQTPLPEGARIYVLTAMSGG